MAIQFAIPKQQPSKVLTIDTFKGVDLYNSPSNVAKERSPEAPNMVRDQVGKVRKRMGYKTMSVFPAKIYGAFTLNGVQVIHADKFLYVRGTDPNPPPDPDDPPIGDGGASVSGYWIAYEHMNMEKSKAVQFDGKLYILDGKTFLSFDGTKASPVSEDAYIPTAFIGKVPSGGGAAYEPFNLLGRGWIEAFAGNGTDRIYKLSTSALDEDKVLCEIWQTDGTWKSATEGTEFSVDRTLGTVTFVTAPAKPPVIGMDNVKITAFKRRDGFLDRINRCDIATLYGVGGAPDRLFVAGNPAYPNIDYYSEQNKPNFFGDSWFTLIGQDDSKIMGYSILNNQLAAHKSGGSDEISVIVRSGTLNAKDEALFPIVNTLQGQAAVSKYSFASMGTEALFLTSMGVYAITAQELTGEKYSQQRSIYISSVLQEAPDLKNAVAFVWRDFYILATGDRLYMLDGLQKEYQKDTPYSSFQYECYYSTGIGATVLWEDEGALWFGTEDGSVCRFHTDVDNPENYNDDGNPILAYWDTPDIDGGVFYKNKTFRYVAVRLAAAIVTGVKVFAQKRGLWDLVYDAGEKARYFSGFAYVNFAKFVFSADKTPRTLGGKINLKKVDKARFRFQNGELNEPFGIYSVGFEFKEPGSRYKG